MKSMGILPQTWSPTSHRGAAALPDFWASTQKKNIRLACNILMCFEYSTRRDHRRYTTQGLWQGGIALWGVMNDMPAEITKRCTSSSPSGQKLSIDDIRAWVLQCHRDQHVIDSAFDASMMDYSAEMLVGGPLTRAEVASQIRKQ